MIFINGVALEKLSDFKYLGSYIASTIKDFNIGKGLTWKAGQSSGALSNSDKSL